ncbi:MAG: hypothetical protein ACRDI3_00940 [Actinomycetota bacterium]
MTRLPARPKKANPIVRFSYWLSRVRTGKIADPLAVRAHHPWVMMSYGTYELMFERANRVDKRVHVLAASKVSAMIGCHW